jgi:hypothetical protein
LSSVPATTPASATRLTLGAEYNGTAPVSSVSPLQVPLAGQIDEVRLWNGARSQSEIQAAMYSRMGGAEAGLVGYWPLDEGSGNTTADKAGSQTGVLIGGPGWIRLIAAAPARAGSDLCDAGQHPGQPITLVGIDPEGGAVTYAVFTAPAHGAVQISGAQSGAFTYTPATDFVGADAFVYQVADTGGLTDTATVTVTMSPPATGAIEGVVFDDLNGNGVKDVGEAGVAGVTVSRSGGADTATASDGAYRFGDVPVGKLHRVDRRARRLCGLRPDQPHGECREWRRRPCQLRAPGAGCDPGRGLRRPQRQQGAGSGRTRHCRRDHHARRWTGHDDRR